MSETTFTKAEVTMLAIALIALSFAVGVIGIITGMSIVGKNSPPPYIPFSIPEVTIAPPDSYCTFKRIGDTGITTLRAVYQYSCPYGTWLGVIQSNGTVIWSKAP